MAITKLNFVPSEGLKKEISTIDSWSAGHSISKLFPPMNRPEDFFAEETAKGVFQELERVLPSGGIQLKVLDVGVGIGKSSVFIALRGHSVTAVEPSSEQCRILDSIASQFQLPIDIYEGPAEALDQVSEGSYDLCIFNGALHHCDNPVVALKFCRRLLKPEGRLILLNEPILKPFRSKRWYFRQLEMNPQKMGHYGGNEHIYYAWEYLRMLKKAGFRSLEFKPAGFVEDIRTALIHLATANQCGHFLYSEKKLVQHAVWHIFLSRIFHRPLLGRFFARLSLMPLTFSAYPV